MAMKITVQQLKRAVPETNSLRAQEFVDVFNEWSEKFGINTPIRTAHFLSQCWHESGALRYVEEIASGAQYEGRKDLGNTHPGDGKKYKGRGFIQVTGFSNYLAYKNSGFCVGDLMNHPEWLCKKPGHTKASMWYWKKNGCNELADRDNGINANEVCKSITLKVNGGYNGLSQRQFYMRRFKKEFGL